MKMRYLSHVTGYCVCTYYMSLKCPLQIYGKVFFLLPFGLGYFDAAFTNWIFCGGVHSTEWNGTEPWAKPWNGILQALQLTIIVVALTSYWWHLHWMTKHTQRKIETIKG